MKKTTLVVMAAGIGSRFGKGIKQLAKVGPGGQIIMDYSIHDAVAAGFDKVVFVIRPDIEEEFREVIGRRMEERMEVAYAFQELADLPEGFSVPEGRTKPWGTGQAVLCCRDAVSEPFCVINADDYYGREPFQKIHNYLVAAEEVPGAPMPISMAGFRLKNTLSDNGSVTRGICHLDANDRLIGVEETYDIVKTADGAAVEKDGTMVPLDANAKVSMNMWGLQSSFIDALSEGFTEFLSKVPAGDIKAEFLLPGFIDKLIREGRAVVDVLDTDETWFGVTYQEDRDKVVGALAELTKKGVYPENF